MAQGMVLAAPIALAAGMHGRAQSVPEFKWKSVIELETPRKEFLAEEQTYPLRFVIYLTRFLLNFDPRSVRYWDQAAMTIPLSYSSSQVKMARLRQYGKFAASVEVGLREFKGPGGVRKLFDRLNKRFTSTSAKRQLAILFSFLKEEQPVSEIERLIAEADNGSISQISVLDEGSGYTREPIITISLPIGGGIGASAKALMKPTGRLGKVLLKNKGSGYVEPPDIIIDKPSQEGGEQATAVAEIDADGSISRIVLTNRGSGYSLPPNVLINDTNPQDAPCQVAAAAEVKLDLKVAGIVVENGGTTYGRNQRVNVDIEPQQEDGMCVAAKANATLKIRPQSKRTSKLLPESISQQLTQLIPDSTVPEFDDETGTFTVKIPFDHVSSSWLLEKESRCGGALDPIFGPRGCSPVEREKDLDVKEYAKFAISGALCAAISHAALTPLEVVKTKAQNNPESGLGEIVGSTVKLGPSELFRGIGPTVAGFFVGGGIGFGLTEFFRRLLTEYAGQANAELYQVPIVITASIIAVIFTCIGVVPFEAVRIKMQSDAGFADQFIDGFLKIGKDSGLGGYYDGLGAILFKEIPFALCKFAVFDLACQAIYDAYPAARETLSTALLVSVLGGSISGGVAAIISHPADTVLTKMYRDQSRKIGIFQATSEITDTAGVRGLFAGLIPRVIFAAVLLGSEFLIYDYLKILLKVSPDYLGQYLDGLSSIR